MSNFESAKECRGGAVISAVEVTLNHGGAGIHKNIRLTLHHGELPSELASAFCQAHGSSRAAYSVCVAQLQEVFWGKIKAVDESQRVRFETAWAWGGGKSVAADPASSNKSSLGGCGSRLFLSSLSSVAVVTPDGHQTVVPFLFSDGRDAIKWCQAAVPRCESRVGWEHCAAQLHLLGLPALRMRSETRTLTLLPGRATLRVISRISRPLPFEIEWPQRRDNIDDDKRLFLEAFPTHLTRLLTVPKLLHFQMEQDLKLAQYEMGPFATALAAAERLNHVRRRPLCLLSARATGNVAKLDAAARADIVARIIRRRSVWRRNGADEVVQVVVMAEDLSRMCTRRHSLDCGVVAVLPSLATIGVGATGLPPWLLIAAVSGKLIFLCVCFPCPFSHFCSVPGTTSHLERYCGDSSSSTTSCSAQCDFYAVASHRSWRHRVWLVSSSCSIGNTPDEACMACLCLVAAAENRLHSHVSSPAEWIGGVSRSS